MTLREGESSVFTLYKSFCRVSNIVSIFVGFYFHSQNQIIMTSRSNFGMYFMQRPGSPLQACA